MTAVVALTIRVDDGELARRLDHIMRQERHAVANALTTTMRSARKSFTANVTPDAVGNEKTSFKNAVRRQVSNIRSASAENLSATMIVRATRFDVSPLIRSVTPGNQHRPGGATVSTFMLTGGGSANLSKTKFFQIQASGGKVILERKGGRLHRIYAEQPISAFAQEKSQPRKAWDKAIDFGLADEIAKALQVVFDGGSAPAAQGDEG